MPLDTTFAPAQVDIASGLQGLMQQYKQAQLERTRKDAVQGLMQGGDIQSSVAKLLGAGDTQGAQALTAFYKVQHPQLSPGEVQAHEDRMLALQAQYPGMFAGDTQGTQTTAQGATQAPPMPYPLPKNKSEVEANNAAARAWGTSLVKNTPPPKEDARKAHDLVGESLDTLINASQALIDDPYLPAATGGWVNAIPAIAKSALGTLTGQPSMMMKDYPPGYGNIAPESMVAGTPVKGTQERLKTLGTQIAVNAVQSQRALSKTGAAVFSRLTQYEFIALQNSVAALNAAQTPEDIKKSLQMVKEHAEKLKKANEDDFTSRYGESTATKAPQQAEDTGPPLNAPPVGGATQPIATKQTPEQTRSFLDSAAPGTSGTLHLSDGTSVKAQKRIDGHWYDSSGKRIH